MTDHLDMLQRLLPLLRDAHRCVSGIPFAGSRESLRVELGLAAVKLDRHVRKALADDIFDAEERFAFDAALETVAAMDSGAMPFDELRYDGARDYMKRTMLRSIAKQRETPEPPKRRAGRH